MGLKACSSKKGAWVRVISAAVATLQTLRQRITIHCSMNLIIVDPCIIIQLISNATNVKQLGAILFFAHEKSTLHVSGALCTHHQECLKTVHAVTGTIMYRSEIRSRLL